MANVKNYMVGNDTLTIEQINHFANSVAYKHSKIRVMPDGHAGKGAVVGSTITYTDKIVPNTVGVDIACRVTGFCLGNIEIDFEKLDHIARQNIPTGFNVRNQEHELSKTFPYEDLVCWSELKNQDRLRKSMGTLGGGNHYIEIDYDDNTENYWLVIHCGSRNLGKQVAEYYQNIAINAKKERIQELNARKRISINAAKSAGCIDSIQNIVNYWNARIAEEPDDDMCYLEGQDMQNYLHDMRICNDFSKYNHIVIFQEIAEKMGW